jgi:hypothetical protein
MKAISRQRAWTGVLVAGLVAALGALCWPPSPSGVRGPGAPGAGAGASDASVGSVSTGGVSGGGGGSEKGSPLISPKADPKTDPGLRTDNDKPRDSNE